MEKIIKLEKDDILRLPIYTSEGNPTGEVLEFDLKDIELPIKYQELIERDKKNRDNLQKQFLIIDKKEDVNDGGILSRNEKEKLKLVQEFLKEEVKIYNLFLGENGVEKLLNGSKLRWDSLKMIDKIIEEQIVPHLDFSIERMNEQIKEKYGEEKQEEIEVLE